MAKSLNQVVLFGNVGRDPEVVEMNGGATRLVKFSLATSRKIGRDKPEETQWHTCVAWASEKNKLGDLVAQLVTKGSRVLVVGELRYRQWEHKEGHKVTSAEIHVTDFSLGGGGEPRTGEPRAAKVTRAPAAVPAGGGDDFEDFPAALQDDDDLPF